MEDPVEVQFPSRNRILIILRTKNLRGLIPPAPFDDISPDSCNSSGIESTIGGRSRNVDRGFNSRRQLAHCITYGLAELIQPSSIHPPVKGFADIGTV